MNLADSHFRFNALLKHDQNIEFTALELFPHLSEISFNSRTFPNYAECISSCKLLMEDMSTNINERQSARKFKVGAEVNPLVSGTATLSKDWSENEVARFWVYDKAMEGNGSRIDAVCKGSVFAVPKVTASHSFH